MRAWVEARVCIDTDKDSALHPLQFQIDSKRKEIEVMLPFFQESSYQ